jgi:hypothetical protein
MRIMTTLSLKSTINAVNFGISGSFLLMRMLQLRNSSKRENQMATNLEEANIEIELQRLTIKGLKLMLSEANDAIRAQIVKARVLATGEGTAKVEEIIKKRMAEIATERENYWDEAWQTDVTNGLNQGLKLADAQARATRDIAVARRRWS